MQYTTGEHSGFLCNTQRESLLAFYVIHIGGAFWLFMQYTKGEPSGFLCWSAGGETHVARPARCLREERGRCGPYDLRHENMIFALRILFNEISEYGGAFFA